MKLVEVGRKLFLDNPSYPRLLLYKFETQGLFFLIFFSSLDFSVLLVYRLAKS